METSLVPLDENKALKAFKEKDGLEPLLAAIEKESRSKPVVLNTENGRKNIKSLAYSVAQAKQLLDRIGKKLNEEHQREIKIVNAARSSAFDRLEKLQAEILKPLVEWEAEDKARIAAHENAIADMEAMCLKPEDDVGVPSSEVQRRIDAINSINRKWEEYETRFQKIKKESLLFLNNWLQIETEREAAEAEQKRIAEEEAARAQQEREEMIAREAAKAAREAAEEAAAIDIVWEQAHRENAEYDRKKAEEAAELAKEEAEDQYWRSIYAAADAENEAFDAKARAKAVAEKEAADALQAAADKRAAEAAARLADEQNRARVLKEIADAIEPIIENLRDELVEPSEVAEEIAAAMHEGRIPNVEIHY